MLQGVPGLDYSFFRFGKWNAWVSRHSGFEFLNTECQVHYQQAASTPIPGKKEIASRTTDSRQLRVSSIVSSPVLIAKVV